VRPLPLADERRLRGLLRMLISLLRECRLNGSRVPCQKEDGPETLQESGPHIQDLVLMHGIRFLQTLTPFAIPMSLFTINP